MFFVAFAECIVKSIEVGSEQVKQMLKLANGFQFSFVFSRFWPY